MERTESIPPDSPGSGYQFDGLRLEAGGKLFRGDAAVELSESERKALRELVVHAGQIVTFAHLRQAMQGEGSSPRNDLHETISSLQRKLGIADCIEPMYRRGYRFCSDVKRYGPGEASTALRLAILPFEAGNDVPEYIAEALTEEIARRLKRSGSGSLHVLEHDSVSTLARRFTNTSQIAGATQIGSAMKADLVLGGGVQSLPGRFRARIEMRRGSDGVSLWGEDLIQAGGRVAVLAGGLADRISMRVGDNLSITASEEEEEVPYPQEAYELFWRAHSKCRTMQRYQMEDSLRRLERAVELAPHWLEARVEFINLCAIQATYGFMAPQAAAAAIRRAAEEFPDRSSEALLPALGWAYFHADRNLRAAQLAFDRSDHLRHDRRIIWTRTNFALSRHRFSEAIALLEDSIRLDPFCAGLHARLAWALHLAGDAEESVKRIEYASVEFSEDELVKLYAGMILPYYGEAERGVSIAEALARECPHFDLALSAQAYALACAGRQREAIALLEQQEWLSRERFVLRVFNSAVHVALGDYDAAIEELRISNHARCPWFFEILADPRLKPLWERNDFRELATILPWMEAGAATEP